MRESIVFIITHCATFIFGCYMGSSWVKNDIKVKEARDEATKNLLSRPCTRANMDNQKCHAYNDGECMNGIDPIFCTKQ
jgi:hypothetical protein